MPHEFYLSLLFRITLLFCKHFGSLDSKTFCRDAFCLPASWELLIITACQKSLCLATVAFTALLSGWWSCYLICNNSVHIISTTLNFLFLSGLTAVLLFLLIVHSPGLSHLCVLCDCQVKFLSYRGEACRDWIRKICLTNASLQLSVTCLNSASQSSLTYKTFLF